MDNNREPQDRIYDIDIQDEMKKSYIDYAMSVIVARALPDVRDGLKPVHRRILFAMSELGLSHDKKYRKSARIVGDVLGKYHPHGDSSVYNAMVRMAQAFSMRGILVDGQGNFGSIDGDSAAAMRYTEAKMTKLAGELLKDIGKKTVDFKENFDGEEKEPTVMPARYPNLLVNGSNGIAVGMATTIPPHNLAEIIDATIALIDDASIDDDELIEYVSGPDFPTGATIMGVSGFRKAYKTGRGRVVVRSKFNIEEYKNGKTAIIITEVPYQVNKAKMLENIADLVRNKKIEGITDLRDESNRIGIRVVIELRKDINPQVMLNQLYKHTQLQSTVSINMIALVKGQPKLLNLREILTYYIEHQKEVETRRVQFDLAKAEARAHILEGYRIAIDNIDEVIAIIRGAYNDAEQKLMERFGLSEIQAKAIVDMRLRRLQGLEREKIEDEYQELLTFINECKALLADEVLLFGVIKENLLEVKSKYSDARRTNVEIDYNEIDIEDLIDEEQVTVTLTHAGYIKRVPVDVYATQNRGGRGKTGLSTREEDHVIDIFMTSTHDYLLFFTNKGKVYRMKAYQIPEGSRLSKGTAIINILPVDQGEKVTAVIPVKDFDNGYLIMMTKNGVIKKTHVTQYDTSRKTGIIGINLREDDELIGVRLTTGSNEIISVTNHGKSIRFNEEDVREMGRTATGVRGIALNSGDYVVSVDIVTETGKLLVISENGYGKRTKLDEYRIQNRGGKGIITYNVTDKTGYIVGASVVEDDDQLILINSAGVIIRITVEGISTMGRSTSGVRLMKIGEENELVAFAKIKDFEEGSELEIIDDNEVSEENKE
ncbi:MULTISPECIES: DNA gyrase subunit A [unclassified Fusibacter]|uniref:DNA gyrase subunit A n=1 Tax=unclassified Fusibacter TaxID=2624464 RepID=UPI0010103D12|nr:MULTISPECIES: DNA gyrase subunit A [unclassified Fusibacter]MCK8060842.1 DNA gyrase subunit A [Fusibacter sp. A2]NPE23138.1 DNA gyrase subunit A [Fusibacter sp. A1]RXV59496.1 DNA gyrase subunit A [Fusibacter sp. A1]